MAVYSVAKTASRPTVAELKAMGPMVRATDEVERLQGILEPAADDQIGAAILWMFKVLPMAGAGGNDEDRRETMAVLREGYMLALREYPMWAIVEARDAFIKGAVEGFTGSFAPNPADLGREVGKRVDAYRLKLGRAKHQAENQRRLEAEGEHSGRLSDQTREIARAAIERLKAASAAEKVTVSDEPDRFAEYRVRSTPGPRLPPLTAEDLSGIPDAPKRGMTRIPVPSFDFLPKRQA